jgi:pimeloyl-ACP methyl ester carboxylesterase
MTTVSVRLGSQEVEDHGDGPPLLWLGSCFGEAPWTAAHQRLATTRRVVAPHAPTMREGGVLEHVDTMEDYVLHLVDVMDAAGLDRPAVVGASFGGWLAAELAARHPDRVRALALVDAMGLRLVEAPAAEVFAPGLPALARLLLHDPRSVDVAAIPVFDRTADPMASIARLVEGQEAMARMGWSPYLHDPRLPERIDRYRGPALVVWGADDRVLAPAYARAWADLFDAPVEIVPDAGHLPAIEQPDRVVELITGFLAPTEPL